jgi:hypothetical protein
MEYAKAKFLIYNCWETIGNHGGVIAGSLILGHAMTEEEAAEKIDIYRARHEEFNLSHPFLKKPGDKTRFVSIVNQPEWWL